MYLPNIVVYWLVDQFFNWKSQIQMLAWSVAVLSEVYHTFLTPFSKILE